MRALEFILLSFTLTSVLIAIAVAGYFRVKKNGISFTQYRFIIAITAMLAAVSMLCIGSLAGIV